MALSKVRKFSYKNKHSRGRTGQTLLPLNTRVKIINELHYCECISPLKYPIFRKFLKNKNGFEFH